MPELPEVETIARDLQKSILNKTISVVDVIDPFVVKQPKAAFIRGLKQQAIQSVVRRGKALSLQISSGELLIVQVMMTGQLVFNGKPDKHTRVLITFSDKTTLLYNDQRRFGHLKIVKQLNEVNYFNILGPEPLSADFTVDYLHEKANRSTRPVKNFLLDHTVVAGIGNIYACEILFRSRISPERKTNKIKPAEAKIIHQHIIEVLQQAITARGSSMRNYRDGAGQKGKFSELIRVYAKEAQPCVVCRKPIKRIVQSGRSSFFCPQCQR